MTPPPTRPVLFSSVRSPHAFKVAVALVEQGVAFDRVEIDLPGGEQRTPAYLAIQPKGTVPAYLAADGTAYLDSLDVLLHLDALGPRLFPGAPRPRGEVLAWIERSSGPMRDVSHHLYGQLLEPPRDGPDPARVAELKARGLTLLAEVDGALARSAAGRLVDADDLPGRSAADLCVYAWTSGFRRFDLPGPGARLPHLDAWWRAWDARPSVTASRGAVGLPFARWLERRAS